MTIINSVRVKPAAFFTPGLPCVYRGKRDAAPDLEQNQHQRDVRPYGRDDWPGLAGESRISDAPLISFISGK
ncbi:hypothetical protein [Pseudomonas oryzihabitans]|uniref:hypothetical protein n=1 Tax=Pseudomonas oryzihabitans TaxID=47885 RepID=UPI0028651C39|nr:hypothetical protein [Pseudomonas psychrotolerans]MDR6678200.1 hypothetical protein [Pseudomonas psychrotolerans]